jgi:predicted ATPase
VLTRYVLTGAPGSGKISVLHELRRRGHEVVEEAAIDVMAVQRRCGIDEPWLRDDFVDLIVALQRGRAAVPLVGSVRAQVHDRSPLCTVALARYLGRPVAPLLAGEMDRVLRAQLYAQSVLLVRSFGFIEPTPARRISYAESLAFERVHETVYHEYGFDLVDIPPGRVTDRADAVEAHILSRSGAVGEP